ncbi:MAG: formate--tetrahydrofolate ligase [Candidatus Didemnitutus sp.]|nr:formate--tetrahydrofolate ligase [Candidatus Didemnitutus sp.]
MDLPEDPMKKIADVAREIGIAEKHLVLFGQDKAKVALEALENKPSRGKLILVSAITPTPAGEGKTVTSIGLAQGIAKLGKRAALALRQPSMGPVFGRKGGATGGGRSTVQPAVDINLHFNGDFHAITSAHNLLASIIDNQLHLKQSRLTPTQVLWKRVLDVNDRALRNVVLNAGGKSGERRSGFDITAASEIMAILCLSESMRDLRARLDRIVIGFTTEGVPVRASEFKATGALLALLRDALKPNLVQTCEGVPAFVHGGPFANIAHGCNSVLATRLALAHADFVVTEAGFAFDLGGEKFIDIKCRQTGLNPDAIVLVATVRALKLHGGAPADALAQPDFAALERGLANLEAHVTAARNFNRPVTVALNKFPSDTPDELVRVRAFCHALGVECEVSEVFAKGGEGGLALAETVLHSIYSSTPPLQYTYRDEQPIREKMEAIAHRFYGADGVDILPEAEIKLGLFEIAGFGKLPVCMAKTQNSLTDDPEKIGRPRGFRVTVRDFELAAGAGFVVALTGQMMRMPALPKVPAAEHIDVDASGDIVGISGT